MREHCHLHLDSKWVVAFVRMQSVICSATAAVTLLFPTMSIFSGYTLEKRSFQKVSILANSSVALPFAPFGDLVYLPREKIIAAASDRGYTVVCQVWIAVKYL